MEKIIKLNNKVCATEHHLIQTNRGLVEAGMLREGDEIIGSNSIGVITKIHKSSKFLSLIKRFLNSLK